VAFVSVPPAVMRPAIVIWPMRPFLAINPGLKTGSKKSLREIIGAKCAPMRLAE
jgi:hypothetical protein